MLEPFSINLMLSDNSLPVLVSQREMLSTAALGYWCQVEGNTVVEGTLVDGKYLCGHIGPRVPDFQVFTM